MTETMTPKELLALAASEAEAGAREETVSALRSYAELSACLDWLCAEKDALVTLEESEDVTSSCCTEPRSLLEMAKSLGWPGLEEL